MRRAQHVDKLGSHPLSLTARTHPIFCSSVRPYFFVNYFVVRNLKFANFSNTQQKKKNNVH